MAIEVTRFIRVNDEPPEKVYTSYFGFWEMGKFEFALRAIQLQINNRKSSSVVFQPTATDITDL